MVSPMVLPSLRMVGSSPYHTRTKSKRMNIKASLPSTITSFCCKPLKIFTNKVLISVAVSSSIAKILKPFTSFVLYDHRRFDIRDAFLPAGFPSTHSTAAVSAAMALGFGRGFSDSVFGMALVFACLIMFDAQGFRRQVGNHAEVINKAVLNAGDVPLKESVGHTKVEVIGGAVLGFVVSVAIALVSSLVHLVI